MARSLDGGNTFENFKVSDQAHTPSPISGLAGGYAGDYIGVASLNNIAYPFWADNRTGNYQGWMSVVTFGPPCPVDPPSNPNPANGVTDVSASLPQLSWTNGAGASQCEVWFGEAGNMILVYDGSLISMWSIPSQLNYSTLYNWQIVNKNDTCDVSGSLWSFTTEDDPSIVTATLFFDDFESGIGQWTVTNDGGTCVWEIFSPPYPNSYTLPATSSGGLLAADSDECGSGTTLLSTATILPILDLSSYTDEVRIEFDSDWNVYDSQDEAHVEVSTNGGGSWIVVWDQVGSDIRNTHVVLNVTALLAGQSNVSVRVRTVQPGYDRWCVLDNFIVYGTYIIPVELESFTAQVVKDGVKLNWKTATETNNKGFEIERMSYGGVFENIGYVAGFGTTTEPKSYSFNDINLGNATHTYRLKQIDYDGTFSYSSEVNIKIELPVQFNLEQNFPNPFNPSIKIKYIIPSVTLSEVEGSLITLKVFDALGNELATLVNEEKPAGLYEIEFNVNQLSKVEISSGIYFYQLRAGAYVETRKMILIK